MATTLTKIHHLNRRISASFRHTRWFSDERKSENRLAVLRGAATQVSGAIAVREHDSHQMENRCIALVHLNLSAPDSLSHGSQNRASDSLKQALSAMSSTAGVLTTLRPTCLTPAHTYAIMRTEEKATMETSRPASARTESLEKVKARPEELAENPSGAAG
jgi:hypothetical protein